MFSTFLHYLTNRGSEWRANPAVDTKHIYITCTCSAPRACEISQQMQVVWIYFWEVLLPPSGGGRRQRRGGGKERGRWGVLPVNDVEVISIIVLINNMIARLCLWLQDSDKNRKDMSLWKVQRITCSGQIWRFFLFQSNKTQWKGGCQSEAIAVWTGITPKFTIQPGKQQPGDHLKGIGVFYVKYQ